MNGLLWKRMLSSTAGGVMDACRLHNAVKLRRLVRGCGFRVGRRAWWWCPWAV
jgi:hypothetical protein